MADIEKHRQALKKALRQKLESRCDEQIRRATPMTRDQLKARIGEDKGERWELIERFDFEANNHKFVVAVDNTGLPIGGMLHHGFIRFGKTLKPASDCLVLKVLDFPRIDTIREMNRTLSALDREGGA
jgi:hypothetical protein